MNVAEAAFAGILRLAGTVTSLVSLLVSVTARAWAVAVLLRLTVAVAVPPFFDDRSVINGNLTRTTDRTLRGD